MKYLIIGATGNTGKAAAEELLKQKLAVRVMGRSADKLAALAAHGAEVFVGDVTDAKAVKGAFTGIDAAYVMIPPNLGASDFRKYQDEVTDCMCDAVATSGTKYIVSLSSVGANHASGVGPIAGLHYMEQQLDGIPDLNTLHLRAGFFMENLFGSLGMIKKMSIYGAACPASSPWPLIATQDIGHYAARRLSALNFSGKNQQYLVGQRDIPGSEVALILGQALGVAPLPYVEFKYEEMKQGMIGAGLPEAAADLFIELYQGFNNGLLDYHRDTESTTPTKLEDFAAQVLKPTYDAM